MFCKAKIYRKKPRCINGALIILALYVVLPPRVLLADSQSAQIHGQAVAMARSGDTATSLKILASLYHQYPDDTALRNDYAVIAAWNGDDQLTQELLATVDPASLPNNVIAVYAKSLRNLREWDRSLALYQQLIARQPAQLDGYLGEVLVLADAGRFSQAENALAAIPTQFTSDAQYTGSLQLTCGYVAERQGHFTAALACYNKGLRAEPDNRELRKRRVMTASALGAANFALQEAEKDPGLLTEEELARLQIDAAAMQIRWADLPRQDGTDNTAKLAVAAHRSINPGSAANIRQLQFDKIVALSTAQQMAEAVAEFELLQQTTPLEQIPYYVLGAAGRAYLYLEQSAPAIICYRIALQEMPSSAGPDERFNLRMGLFYALSDAQEFDEASALIESINAQEAAWIRPTNRLWLANDRYAVSQEAAAMSLAYREEYDAALEQLDQLIAIAPASVSLRLSRATVTRWRGWHRSSAADLDKVHKPSAQFSKNISSAHLAFDTQNFDQAEQLVQELNSAEPSAKAVIDLNRRWNIHQKPQLFVDASGGESDGNEVGSKSYAVDSRYYSAPISQNYRLMLHDNLRYSKFDDGPARDHRLGAGVEYRGNYWTLTTEVNKGLEDNDDAGASVSADWEATDHWLLATQGNYNSPYTPLQAVRNNIKANDLNLNVRYRSHEARSVDLRLGVMDLDDGNLREWIGSSYSQRLVNLPHHKIQGSVDVYFSRNSIDNAPYFNPSSDRELTLGLEHEWRIYHDYQRSLIQRAGIYGGVYDQNSYGSDSLWKFRLEHDWQLSDRLNISYGFEFSRRPYDGKQEDQESLFFAVGCRI